VSDCLYFEDFAVGESFELGHIELSEAQIRAYGERFDPRPQHGGPAVSPVHTALTASPWHLCGILMRLNYDGLIFRTAARGAPGIDMVHWLQLAYPGDRLTARATVLNARVSQSKPQLGLVQFRYEVLTEDREQVLSQENYVIVARRNNEQAALEQIRAEPTSRPQKLSAAASDQPARPQRVQLGTVHFTSQSIIAFARDYDPQPFHLDEAAAKNGPFGALAASGWHTASAWMRTYVEKLQRGGSALPQPERFLSLQNLRWLYPVYAGDSITFDFTPVAITKPAAGKTIVTSHNSGFNQHAIKVYEFTATMTIEQS
jgi:acyl dehydratase